IGGKVQCEDSEQHQAAAKKGVKKELDGGILTPRSAPDADKKVHRQEHNFPKAKEEKKIEGYKDAHHAAMQQQEKRKVSFNPFIDAPGGKNTEEAQQRGKQHH